jgi:carbamoyltransferase
LLQCAHYKDVTRERNLCLGGGVALNCVANGVIERSLGFETVWVPPAAMIPAMRSGRRICYLLHMESRLVRLQARTWASTRTMKAHVRISEPSVRDNHRPDGGCPITGRREPTGSWKRGWLVQGPRRIRRSRTRRARSILADPRRADMRDHVNAKIQKSRELPAVSRPSASPTAPLSISDATHEFAVHDFGLQDARSLAPSPL